MNPILTQEGAYLLWQFIFGLQFPLPFRLHLMGQAVQPLHTWTQATFAPHELSAPGYAPISLSNPAVNWQFVAIPQGQQAVNQAPLWNFTGPCTVYGWWISDSNDTHSLMGNLWPAPYVFAAGGGPFFVTLAPTLISVP